MTHENKQTRHFTIREILSTLPIANQDKLRVELNKRGLKVTQATLSRDLRELGVSRSASAGKMRYIAQQSAAVQALSPVIGEEIISINANECLIIVNTLPGCASVVGEFIDVQKNLDILGTLAGDNALIVIPASCKKIKQLIRFLKTLFLKGNK